MSEVNESLPELSTSQYVIQIEHQGTENEQYAIKDYALTQRVQELEERLENYYGTIQLDNNFLTTTYAPGSYWVTGITGHYIDNYTEQLLEFEPNLPAWLIVNTDQSSVLITAEGEIWMHEIKNEQHVWTNKWDDYYTKDEVDALLEALENDYNGKIQQLNGWIESLSQEIASLKSQVQAIGAITGGSNPLTGNILILGDNSLFNTAISGEVNMAQRLADKLNLPASSGIIWLQNSNTDDLYSYLQYSYQSFGGIYLPAENQSLSYSESIALRMAANDAVIVPFNDFSVVVYIANMGDIATLNSATDLNKSATKVTTNITWEDGDIITYNETNYQTKIPVTIAFSSSTPTTHAQAVIEFITPLIADGGVVYITTPITWNLNGNTALTSLQTSCKDALLVGLQAVANKNSLTYKSIYCIGELQRGNCLAADSKTVTSETAIDNYISNLCTMINEIKNNNVTFTPVNLNEKGTLVIKKTVSASDIASATQNTVHQTAGDSRSFTMATAGSGTIVCSGFQNKIAAPNPATYTSRLEFYYKKSTDAQWTSIVSSGYTPEDTTTPQDTTAADAEESNVTYLAGKTRSVSISWNAGDVIQVNCYAKMSVQTAGSYHINYPWTIKIISA